MTEERGSTKLLGASEISERDLARTIEVLRKGGSLDDYFPLGKPNPEVFTATLSVVQAKLADLLRDLTAIEGIQIRRLEAFPKGIPRPLDYIVQVQVGGAVGR